MSGAESNMRQRVALALHHFDPVSVENPAHPGTPDLNCSLGWLELKVIDGWPVRPTTPVRIPHFTPQQRVWLTRRWRCDRRAWLLLKVSRGNAATWMLFDGRTAAEQVGKCTAERLYADALAVWTPHLIDDQLIQVLRGEPRVMRGVE